MLAPSLPQAGGVQRISDEPGERLSKCLWSWATQQTRFFVPDRFERSATGDCDHRASCGHRLQGSQAKVLMPRGVDDTAALRQECQALGVRTGKHETDVCRQAAPPDEP